MCPDFQEHIESDADKLFSHCAVGTAPLATAGSTDEACQSPQGRRKDHHIQGCPNGLQTLKLVENGGKLLFIVGKLSLARKRGQGPDERDEQMYSPEGGCYIERECMQ